VPPAEPPAVFFDDEADGGPANAAQTRVTVLLVMEPRRHGFRAFRRMTNPVLCIGEGCYVSAGAEDEADYMPRWKALGPGNTLGRRAGPCREQLTCVFRGVELGRGSASIQPVDMSFWHHDRREVQSAAPDRTCEVVAHQLHCAATIVAHGWRAWIVPEGIAAQAGPDALEEALEDGLPTGRSAERDPWWTSVHDRPTR
jgi:colicin import membrane protein